MTITSAQEESTATHREEVRKSGIFGNGGLSITIGTQKQTDTYDAKNSVAKGSVIGSRFGSVSLGATGTAQVEASDVTSKGDIQVQGSGVTIRNGYTTSHTEETHTFSKTGLTLSVSNRLVDTTSNAVGTLTRASAVKDERLQALLAYKTYDDAKRSLAKSKLKDQAKSLHLNLSLGTESSEASTNVDSKIAKGSTVVSEGHIRVATKKDDIHIEGSDVQGKDITLDSAKSIYVRGKETTSKMTQTVKQKQASLGVSYDLLQHRFSDISVNASGSKGNIAGTDIVHDPSNITATNTLGVNTKQDVHIKDGVLKGEAIQANVGGNLDIQSVQDTHDYTDHTTSSGMGLSLSKKGAFNSIQGSLQRTDIDSKYSSVIHPSGMYAGHTGFNISVGNTTTLEGALLSSKTDTNTLKTKQLVMKDMENRAKYTYGSKGVSYLSDVQYRESLKHIKDRKNAILTDSNLNVPAKIQRLQQLNQEQEYTSHLKYVNSLHNQVGLLPNMLPGERKEAYTVTRSAIVPGKVDVENPKVDASQINRDINHSLQALDTIFNKQDIQERQELTKLFNQYANEAIHHISDMAGWKEGSSEKVALHAIVGNISANIVNGNTNVGTAAGGLSELLAPAILEASHYNPARAQWLAYALGYAIDKLAGGTGELGGSISHYGVKWNSVNRTQYAYTELENAIEDIDEEVEAELALSRYNDLDPIRKNLIRLKNIPAIFASRELENIDGEYKIAAKMFNLALNDGNKKYFPKESEEAELLINNSAFRKYILEEGARLDVNTGIVISNGLALTDKAKLAFGKVKLAVRIFKNPDGGIGVVGLAKDAYNFEHQDYYDENKSFDSDYIFSIIKHGALAELNNIGYGLQRAGEVHPYKYSIQINTVVYP